MVHQKVCYSGEGDCIHTIQAFLCDTVMLDSQFEGLLPPIRGFEWDSNMALVEIEAISLVHTRRLMIPMESAGGPNEQLPKLFLLICEASLTHNKRLKWISG